MKIKLNKNSENLTVFLWAKDRREIWADRRTKTLTELCDQSDGWPVSCVSV